MTKQRRQYMASCEISRVEELSLGGYRQEVSFEGKRGDLPVVVCLHGGPGRPIPFSVGSRGMFPQWTDRAILVCWDQLGCGANNCKLDNEITLERYVDMTVGLMTQVKEKFPRNRLYVFGASWGSMLALHAAVRAPQLIDGVIAWGQIVNRLLYNGEIEREIALRAPKRAQAQLARIYAAGIDCHLSEIAANARQVMTLIDKYTDGRHNRSSRPVPAGGIFKGLLTSPDYTLRDLRAVFHNGFDANGSLWRELLHADLTPLFAQIGIPYAILQGETDLITPTANVRAALDRADNRLVSVREIKGSGHIPSMDALNEIYREMCRMAGV